MRLPVLRSDPECHQHHEQQQAEEGHQALGHRPDPAQAEPAGVGLRPDAGDVGDDVPLLLRRDREVVEHRHGLGPGQHGLVDLGRRRGGQRRRELAVGQGTAGADEVVAGGAVGHEQLLAEADVRAGGADLRRGRDRRAAAQRLDVGGDRMGLRRGQVRGLADVLRAVLGSGHPAGADLEVDGRARRRRSGSAPLAVPSANMPWQVAQSSTNRLRPCGDLRRVRARPARRRGAAPLGDEGIADADQDEHEGDDGVARGRVPAPRGDPAHSYPQVPVSGSGRWW